MQTSFTKEYMHNNCGCYSEQQLAACSFMASATVTLQSILTSEIPLKHKYWFVCKKLLTTDQNRQVAIAVAEIVLPIFERRYPDDKRPREAIEAARSYIAGHITIDQLREKRAYAAAADAADAAAADAADAADAAYAAYAAADAADAAAYAAAAAADAADAADADADAAAADAADVKQQLLDYLINFVNNQ